MASKSPVLRPSSRNASIPDASSSSMSRGLSRSKSGATVYRSDTTRRLQVKSVLFHQTLDWYTATMAIKASIPPAVLVCAIQSDSWINHFKTNAYLAPIISTCVLPALPRAMLVRHNMRLTFAIVVAYCWALLAGWCGVQARHHTTNNLNDISAYNSSAEAVVAIFFIFCIWFTFTVKSAFPNWALHCTLAGILTVALLPSLARAPTMSDVIAESNVILEAFLVGQAVGLVNALILFPQSCRGLFRKDIELCLDGLVAVIQAQRKCMEDISLKKAPAVGEEENGSSSISQLEDALQRFVKAVGKARQDGKYAACEISWGVFDHAKLEEISSLLVDLIPPVSGLSSVADMLQLHVEGCNIVGDAGDDSGSDEASNITSRDDGWQHLEAAMHQNSRHMSETMVKGVEHAKLRLESTNGRILLNKRRARKNDKEHEAGITLPGDSSFLNSFRDVFETGRGFSQENEDMNNKELLDCYIQHRPQVGDLNQYTSEMHYNTLRYFLFLHSQTILSSLGEEFLKLLIFVDDCYTHPKKLLIPPFFYPRYWIERLIGLRATQRDSASLKSDAQTSIKLGASFYDPKNPDHLPPSNLMETIGDYIRKISAIFRSDHAAYGLRGACAIMTVGIIAFLHDSQDFYFAQRFLWALFAIVLSMARTTGSSTFLLLGRVLGTIASMIASYIIWYVVDQKTPGILVLLWLWFLVLGYLFVKFPDFFSIWFVALIASIVMIANELQERKLGEAAIIQSGQAVYRPYIIFPYRLAIVTLGVLIGYFWTIFPYPLSEHSELRENMAKAMYGLARYYMCVQQTILARLSGNFGDISDKTSPGFHLQAARRRIFHKYQTLSTRAQTSYKFLDWEFSLGGRFPKQTYGEMLSILERLVSYMTLASYVSRDLKAPDATSSWWAHDPTGTAQVHLTPGGVTTRMIILHSALSRAHPLPPELAELSIPHLGDFLTRDVPADERFAAAALIHTVNWYLIREINRLTE
ncbi:hypothetical protein TGAMA5MH_08605 [Trichoderma gamsii]|uniref:ER transporter 6TM N-terminal domain-containing protein n=1 Tax=Trichoderma gamsii TaxID=398673 RepID=A0A2K0T233_9HYPO|nr:hypothetical protein TGAMA5MH_08605 [Trichoderma gamsii]